MILQTAYRYLTVRKLRTFLTTLAVVFGVLVIFGVNTIIPSILDAFQANILAAAGQVDVTITHITSEAFSPALLDKVIAVAGVRNAAPALERTVNLSPDYYDHDPAQPDRVTALALHGIDPVAARSLRTYALQEGRFLEVGDLQAALLSQSLADQLGLGLGDTLRMPGISGEVTLQVVGLLPPRLLPGNEEVLVTLPQAQAMTGLSGKINMIEANLVSNLGSTMNTSNGAAREAVLAAIQEQTGDQYQIGSLSSGTELFAALETGQIVINMFGAMALFMGGFIIFNTFRTLVVERRRDIGMLRAIGASQRTILSLILAEGLIQGALGTALGLISGYLLGFGILKVAQGPMSAFINIQLGAPVFSPGLLLTAVVLGIGVTLVSGLLPALQASRVPPLEALRPATADVDTQQGAQRWLVSGGVLLTLALLALFAGNNLLLAPGALLFLVGLILVTPALVLPLARLFGKIVAIIYARDGVGVLAQGNLTRQPSRAAITASATMIGLAVIVAMASMGTSITRSIQEITRRSLGSDFLLIPPSVGVWGTNLGAGGELARDLRGIPGVGVVSTLRFGGSASEGQAVSLLGIDPATFPQVSQLTFMKGDEAAAYSAMAGGRVIFTNSIFNMTLGTDVGDTIVLETPNGPQSYTIAAETTDLLNAKLITAYISQDNLAADFGRSEDVMIQMNLAPGANYNEVETQVRQAAAAYPQFRVLSGKAYTEQMNAQMSAALYGGSLLLLFLAVPSLIAMINTLAISVIERTREIGMLRAVGATQRQVRRMVVAEALLLAGLGTTFGLLGGLYLGYVIIQGIGALFPMSYSFPAAGILAGIAIGLGFGIVAAIVPSRQAARLKVVQALRYE